MEYWIDFGVVDEDGQGESLFRFKVVVEDEQEVSDLWDALLEVLPAGRVGGGFYPVTDDDEPLPDYTEGDDEPKVG